MISVSGRISSVGFYDEFSGEVYARIAPEVSNTSRISYGFLYHMAYPPVEGECLDIKGEWITHPKFGEIIKVSELTRRPPSTREGEIVFLAGFIRGLSKKSATVLIDKYGSLQGVIEICKRSPQELDAVLPKSRKALKALRGAQWDRTEIDIDVFTCLHSAEVRVDQIQKLVRWFGAGSLRVIAQNRPYDFIEVPSIGFSTAEKVAAFYAAQQNREFDVLNPDRLLHGICDVVAKERSSGNVCSPEDVIIKKAFKLLKHPDNRPLPKTPEVEKKLKTALDEALKRGLLKREFGMVYTRGLARAEAELALNVSKLIKAGLPVDKSDLRIVDKVVANSTLSDEQRAAVALAVTRPITLVTGGPGCGKTLTSSKIVEAIKKLGRSFIVLAPTGKAAKRAADVMNEEANTIHRACGLDQEDDVHAKRYGRTLNKFDYFRSDYVIIDECSMIDLNLGFEVVRRIRPGRTRLILIGDVDQLPPVGAGQVFRDLLESGVIPTQRLTKVFRQAGGSPIIDCAYQIRDGNCPTKFKDSFDVRILSPATSKKFDMSLEEEQRAEQEEKIIEEWLIYSIKKYVKEKGLDPIRDIQVYAPQREGPVGLNNLNELLRDSFNPLSADARKISDPIKISGRYIVQAGDKVMQIQNNYKMRFVKSAPAEATNAFRSSDAKKNKTLGKPKKKVLNVVESDPDDIVPVMNGQIGYVTKVDLKNRELEVKFDDLPFPILYKNSKEWGKLTPSYAMSIHKSQGSETPFAFLVLHSTQMVNRPLLYTGWTRAKKGVLLIALPEVVQKAVSSLRGVTRYSGLQKRLLEHLSLPKKSNLSS